MLKHIIMNWPTHPVILTGDGIAVASALGSLYGNLPEIAAGMSIIWVAIQMIMLAAKGVVWFMHQNLD